jgi:hypothetical protein
VAGGRLARVSVELRLGGAAFCGAGGAAMGIFAVEGCATREMETITQTTSDGIKDHTR